MTDAGHHLFGGGAPRLTILGEERSDLVVHGLTGAAEMFGVLIAADPQQRGLFSDIGGFVPPIPGAARRVEKPAYAARVAGVVVVVNDGRKGGIDQGFFVRQRSDRLPSQDPAGGIGVVGAIAVCEALYLTNRSEGGAIGPKVGVPSTSTEPPKP
jgi:hypothetical protein